MAGLSKNINICQGCKEKAAEKNNGLKEICHFPAGKIQRNP
jgi:hypothetical protein